MKVLIIEDEVEINRFLKKALEAESFVVDSAFDGEEGLNMALFNTYDVILLDLHLPKLHGVEVAKRIREKHSSISIIILSVASECKEKVDMLSICDDYITKPFSLQEVIARIRAVTRRGDQLHNNILEVGDLKLDTSKYEVFREDKMIPLRNKEFTLLAYFMRNPGVVLSRGMILECVWNTNVDPFTNTIDVHVRSLRKKINEGFENKLIDTVPTRGYKL